MSTADTLIETARNYLAALERGDIDQALACLADDIVQQEFPNQFSPHGSQRDLAQLRTSAQRGNQPIASQHYEVRSAIAQGNQIALEVEWTGTLAVALGSLSAGSQLRAHCAIFLDFHQGKIVRQRNYDCYQLS
jgi:ketosteroid isomerase-like protein